MRYLILKPKKASEPIQELVTKMWFGGLEPEGRNGPLLAAWLLPPIAPYVLKSYLYQLLI